MSSRNFPLSKVVRLKIRYRLNTTFRELPVPPTLLRKLNWYYVLFATLSTFYQRTISSGQFVAIVSQVVQF